MPLYKFECETCGAQETLERTFEQHDLDRKLSWGHFPDREVKIATMVLAPADHPYHWMNACGGFKQVLDFHFSKPMQPHFSHSTNQYVSSSRQFKDQLKEQSDEMSARMGFDCNYEVVDSRDPKDVGASEAGLDATEKRLVDTGQVVPKAKSFS